MLSVISLLTLASVVTCRLHITGFGPQIETKSFAGAGLNAHLTEATSADPLTVATTFFEKAVTTSDSYSFKVKNHYKSDNGVTHVYLRQIYDGAEIVNADANINVDEFGRVLSMYHTFYEGDQVPEDQSWGSESEDQFVMKQPVDPVQAVIKLAEFVNVPAPDQSLLTTVLLNDDDSVFPGQTENDDEAVVVVTNVDFANDNEVKMMQRYLITEEQRIVPVWDISADMVDQDNWFNVQIDMNGNVLQLVDWVSEATAYNVYPLGVNDPTDGERAVVRDPEDEYASPKGWMFDKNDSRRAKFQLQTAGNNVYAQSNPNGRGNFENSYRPKAEIVDDVKTFNHDLDLSKQPDTYINASIDNLFYYNNIVHDIFLLFGFDEQSGNFQEDNFGRGGRGNDAVIANAQDGSGYNNANFASPPDGFKGRMRMYVWNMHKPMRDGDFENDIIIHEYTHGISTRLTGGPANSNCLGFGESGGLGEAWSDFVGTSLRMKETDTDKLIVRLGEYAAGRGIRQFPYSIDMSINPLHYGNVMREYRQVHSIGTVWATMLYDLYWAFVNKYGFNKDWYSIRDFKNVSARDSLAGNIKLMKNVIDGMKIQPCRPSFVDARDAILKADEVNFNGENYCMIWNTFVRRGLGLKAKRGGRADKTIPAECM
ncbi:hypothetical protein MIR68_007940 [Amoeboaphelidium protococcarum]|nr:hypothetical protein MIR68_007940 [Amoeboaphelidium protococcarum]